MTRQPNKYKVMILSNPLDHEGGIVNYYQIFFRLFENNKIELTHHSIGSRMQDFYHPARKWALYPIYYLLDVFRFIFRLVADRSIRIVQINPSLIPLPLIRDAIILALSTCFHKKTIVFYRGWKPFVVRFLKQHPFLRRLFMFIYANVDQTIVLANRFKNDLVELGFHSSKIIVSSTMFEGDCVLPKTEPNDPDLINFLYLGRISELKGFGEIILAASILIRNATNFIIKVVGHSDSSGILNEYQKQIEKLGLSSYFIFSGRQTGSTKFKTYAESDIYLFPSWTEGCPTSVLEALGAGMHVIASSEGALSEIIRPSFNGSTVRVRDPVELAEKMLLTIQNIDAIRKNAPKIKEAAFASYESKVVFAQFSRIYQELIYGSESVE